MVAIQGIKISSADETKLKQAIQEKATTQQAPKNDENIFVGAQSFTSQGDMKAKNTTAYKSLDAKAQQIIKDQINSANDSNWADMNKMSEELSKNGFSTKVVNSDGSGNKNYLEITNPDGKIFKLWDVGGDGGFGTQDIELDGKLGNFKNEVAAIAAGKTNNIAQVQGAQATESPNALKTVDKTQATAEKAKNIDDKQILNYLKADLRKNGNVAEKEIEPKAQEMLPIYKMLLALDLPWLNRLFNIKDEATTV